MLRSRRIYPFYLNGIFTWAQCHGNLREFICGANIIMAGNQGQITSINFK